MRKIQRQDGVEMTPLCHELRHTLPLVDPEQGDDLTVTDQPETVMPLIRYLLALIPEDQQRGLMRTPTGDQQGDDLVDKIVKRHILQRTDYAFVIRQRGGRLHSVTGYVRNYADRVYTNLLVGAFVGGPTLRRALYDVGIRSIRGSIRDERSIQKFRDKGYTVEPSPDEPGRWDTGWEMEERP